MCVRWGRGCAEACRASLAVGSLSTSAATLPRSRWQRPNTGVMYRGVPVVHDRTFRHNRTMVDNLMRIGFDLEVLDHPPSRPASALEGAVCDFSGWLSLLGILAGAAAGCRPKS